jgi:glycosyltransferase involved in cell wall biosynthesis
MSESVSESVSVIIPAFNAAKFLPLTIDSVLRQTLKPLEILVMDDGSTDDTERVLREYGDKIKVFKHANAGVAASRNELVKLAKGSLISLMDSDDIWHPRYLRRMVTVTKQFPDAAAFFMGHVGFVGDGGHEWNPKMGEAEYLTGRELFHRVNNFAGQFECASMFTARRQALLDLGTPFQVDSCEDFYCYALLSTRHSMVCLNDQLLAYRIRPDSISANRVKGLGCRVRVYEKLEPHFPGRSDFLKFYASHRRSYAKFLFGNKRVPEGREQLMLAIETSLNPTSLAKSWGMLGASYLPERFQPTWPVGYRGHAAA